MNNVKRNCTSVRPFGMIFTSRKSRCFGPSCSVDVALFLEKVLELRSASREFPLPVGSQRIPFLLRSVIGTRWSYY